MIYSNNPLNESLYKAIKGNLLKREKLALSFPALGYPRAIPRASRRGELTCRHNNMIVTLHLVTERNVQGCSYRFRNWTSTAGFSAVFLFKIEIYF